MKYTAGLEKLSHHINKGWVVRDNSEGDDGMGMIADFGERWRASGLAREYAKWKNEDWLKSADERRAEALAEIVGKLNGRLVQLETAANDHNEHRIRNLEASFHKKLDDRVGWRSLLRFGRVGGH